MFLKNLKHMLIRLKKMKLLNSNSASTSSTRRSWPLLMACLHVILFAVAYGQCDFDRKFDDFPRVFGGNSPNSDGDTYVTAMDVSVDFGVVASGNTTDTAFHQKVDPYSQVVFIVYWGEFSLGEKMPESVERATWYRFIETPPDAESAHAVKFSEEG